MNKMQSYLLVVIFLLLPLSGYAAISATTSRTIQGTQPYFLLENLEGVKKQLTDLQPLLGFQYKDATGTIKHVTVNDAATIIIVHENMNINELQAFVPINNVAHNLNSIVLDASSLLSIGDADGDGTNPDASGTITATLLENNTPLNDLPASKFEPCSAYQLVITAGADEDRVKLQARTVYGDPNYRDYDPVTVTYTILPAVAPYTCYANPIQAFHREGVYAGNAAQWDPNKGFIPASTSIHPTTNTTYGNFPTTGFHGAEFTLTLAGTTAEQVINNTVRGGGTTRATGEIVGIYNPGGSSGVTAELTAENAATNVLKVLLKGPNENSTTIPLHSPTMFTFNTLGGATVYHFKLDKWFIARYGVKSSYNIETTNSALTYCTVTLGGGGIYRIPKITEYSNGNVPERGWTGGEPSNPYSHFQRTIGQGLFTEWGFTSREGGLGNDGKNHPGYSNSDFQIQSYWTSEPYDNGPTVPHQFAVSSTIGGIFNAPVSMNYATACVSP